jgi:hypothetical protein
MPITERMAITLERLTSAIHDRAASDVEANRSRPLIRRQYADLLAQIIDDGVTPEDRAMVREGLSRAQANNDAKRTAYWAEQDAFRASNGAAPSASYVAADRALDVASEELSYFVALNGALEQTTRPDMSAAADAFAATNGAGLRDAAARFARTINRTSITEEELGDLQAELEARVIAEEDAVAALSAYNRAHPAREVVNGAVISLVNDAESERLSQVCRTAERAKTFIKAVRSEVWELNLAAERLSGS